MRSVAAPRLLYLPLVARGGANEQIDLLTAFRAHFHTVALDFLSLTDPARVLGQMVDSFVPDVVHLQIQDTRVFDLAALREIRRRHPQSVWTQWCGDVREQPIGHVIDVGKVCDATLVSARGLVPTYREQIGSAVFHWDHAVGDRFFTTSAETDGSIVYCGNNYDGFPASEERRAMVRELEREFPSFRLYGGGWDRGEVLPWEMQASVYQRARCTIGHNNFNDREGYFSDRQFIAMASGVPHVCRWVPGLDEIFSPSECISYRTPLECVEKVRWVLGHHEEASAIGKAGRARVIAEHNWNVRVRQYLDVLQAIGALAGGGEQGGG